MGGLAGGGGGTPQRRGGHSPSPMFAHSQGSSILGQSPSSCLVYTVRQQWDGFPGPGILHLEDVASNNKAMLFFNDCCAVIIPQANYGIRDIVVISPHSNVCFSEKRHGLHSIDQGGEQWISSSSPSLFWLIFSLSNCSVLPQICSSAVCPAHGKHLHQQHRQGNCCVTLSSVNGLSSYNSHGSSSVSAYTQTSFCRGGKGKGQGLWIISSWLWQWGWFAEWVMAARPGAVTISKKKTFRS